MELLDFVNDVIYVHIQFAWILFIKKKIYKKEKKKEKRKIKKFSP